MKRRFFISRRSVLSVTKSAFSLVLFTLPIFPNASFSQQNTALISSKTPFSEPSVSRPRKGGVYTDPVFGTQIKRLTDASSEGGKGFICYYPKLNPFNADESRILVYERGGRWHLFSIAGERLKQLPIRNGQTDPQPRWSPSNPNKLLWFDANKIQELDLQTNVISTIHQFEEYEFITNYDEGNYSADGRIVGLAGRKWPWFGGLQDFFVFDLVDRKIIGSKISATGKQIDWVSISPSGKYLTLLVGTPHGKGQWQGVDVYSLPEISLMPHGYYPFSDHADMGFDANNNEVYVTDNAEGGYPDRLRHIEMYRLDNGEKTDLLGLNWGMSMLISCQNRNAPGWALVSTYSIPEGLANQEVLPFEDEIFAVKLDGSYEVRRLAHHRSQRFSVGDYSYNNYWDQPNAVLSPNGNYVLFTSNWRELGSPEDVYLMDLSDATGWIVSNDSKDLTAPKAPRNVRVKLESDGLQ